MCKWADNLGCYNRRWDVGFHEFEGGDESPLPGDIVWLYPEELGEDHKVDVRVTAVPDEPSGQYVGVIESIDLETMKLLGKGFRDKVEFNECHVQLLRIETPRTES